MTSEPTFLIVGAPRCGTTTLFRYLEEHPDVFMPQVKEVRFFDRKYDKGYGWYQNHFSEWAGQRAIGEASPGYMSSPLAMQRIAEHLPAIKLLVSVRNPADRAYSDYWMRRSLGVEKRSFSEAVAHELDPERPSTGAPPMRYLDRGCYATQLEAMERLFPKDEIKTVVFEEFVEEPGQMLEELLAFIGVDTSFRPRLLGKPVNKHVDFRSKRLRRLTKNAPGIVRRVVGRLNARTADYEPLDPALRERLDRFFAPHNLALEEWLRRDLSIWSR